MMTIAQIMEKMIAFSEGNIHDITQLRCVMSWIFPSEKAIIFSMICAMVIICFTPVFNT